MANCGLCNKDNISFMSGYIINGVSGKVCEECRANLLKLRSTGDESCKQYFRNLIESSPNTNISNFLYSEIESSQISNSKISEAERSANIEKMNAEINSILLSTADSIANHHIESYGNIVTGISALGTGFFSELNASISDVLGTTSSSFENKISEAKDNALYALKKEAHKIICNAVISVSITFVPFSGNMIGIVATGTAVTIVPNQS